MARYSDPNLGIMLCEALGLGSNKVRKIVLTCAAGDIATAVVTFLDMDAGAVVEVVKEFELRPKGEGAYDHQED